MWSTGRRRVSLVNVFRMSGILHEPEEGADLRHLDLEDDGVLDESGQMESKLHRTGVQQLYLEHWQLIVFAGGNVA